MYFTSKGNFCDFVTFSTKNLPKQNYLILPIWWTQKFVILLQFLVNWTEKMVKSIPMTISRILECLKQVFTRFWQDLMSAEMLIANARLVAPRAKLWRLTNMDWEEIIKIVFFSLKFSRNHKISSCWNVYKNNLFYFDSVLFVIIIIVSNLLYNSQPLEYFV